MKIIKRGDLILVNTVPAEAEMRKVLRHLKWDPTKRFWSTKATYSVFIDIWSKLQSSLLMEDKETAAWVDHCKRVLTRLSQLQKGTSDKSIRDVELPPIIDYIWEPYRHQKEAIAFALNLPKCCLWLDMGLGKTYTSITIAKLRHASEKLGGIRKVLVISPRSLMYQWDAEIKTLAPGAVSVIVKGDHARKEKLISNLPDDKLSFLIVTYEGLFTLMDELTSVGFDMFILDEATKMKNPKARRTLATAELCDSIPYGVSLTGMAYVNNPLDLFSQFLAIDKTVYGDNQWVFSNRYIDYGVAGFGKFVRGYKNMNELKQRAYFTAFSRTKNACLDLPERVYQTRKLPLYESQYAWYDNLLGQLSKNLSETSSEPLRGMSDDGTPATSTHAVTVSQVVTMLEKFQQVTAGFITTDDGEEIWLDSPKYNELISILRDSNDKFIIWARHQFVIRKLNELLTQKGFEPVVLNRMSSDDYRKTVKMKFKRGDIKVLILQIQSECRGNDFTCDCSPVSSVFFENTPSIEERAQAEDRQHRIGMVGTAVYIDLVCEDTYDEGIQLLLSGKRRLSEYVREQNLEILLGKGGSVTLPKTKSKKRPKMPSEVQQEHEAKIAEQKDWLTEIPGMESL